MEREANPELETVMEREEDPELEIAMEREVQPELETAIESEVEPEKAIEPEVEPEKAMEPEVEPELETAIESEDELELTMEHLTEPELEKAMECLDEPELEKAMECEVVVGTKSDQAEIDVKALKSNFECLINKLGRNYSLAIFSPNRREMPFPLRKHSKERASRHDLRRLMRDIMGLGKEPQLAIITGDVSGIWALTSSSVKSEKWARRNAPETSFMVQCGAERHRFYRIPENLDVVNANNSVDYGGCTVRGRYRHILIPPSLVNGERCVFIDQVKFKPLKEGSIPDLRKIPAWAPWLSKKGMDWTKR
jgi:hypothetical protein